MLKEQSEYYIIISDSYRKPENAIAVWMSSQGSTGYDLDGVHQDEGSVCCAFEYDHSYTQTYAILLSVLCVVVILGFVFFRRLRQRWKVSPTKLFCLVAAIGIISTLGVFALSKSEVWTMYFFKGESDYFQYADTGMDFYHSMEYLKGNDPYQKYGTIYPPMTNLMFKSLYNLVPESQTQYWQDDYMESAFMRRTGNDLRVWMPTAMIFLLFFIGVALLTYMIITGYIHRCCYGLLALLMIFNYPYLYALERGNVILLAMATALFYMLFYDSPKRWLRELALLSLAVSANLKLYPALFGLMLLYYKRWKDALRVIIYGILLFILPCLFFEGGLQNVVVCLKNVRIFAGAFWPDNIGTSFDKLLFSCFTLAERYLGIPFPSSFYFEGGAEAINRILLLLCLAIALILPKKWQKCLGCTMAIILFSNQNIYGPVFLLLPTTLFFEEESYFNERNTMPFIGLTFCLVCLPVFNSSGDGFSFISFRMQICLLILLVYMIVETIRTLIAKVHTPKAV